MVKRYKASRSTTTSDRGSASGSGKESDQVYCVLLHVVEAINFVARDGSEREQIVMNAALNTVDFEVEGTQSAETIIFNSNCIWECDLAGIKRIKTDHRPVKITFYACRTGGGERKTVGSLLLPVRGLPVISSTGSQNATHLKMFWHKLICISSEFRSHKPEVLLMLAIIKKSILHTKDFDHLMQFTEKSAPTPPMQSPGHSITASMLQSQANVYVQSLVQLGLLQVGNDPLVDCDIIEVVLQLKQLKNVTRLVKSLVQDKSPGSVILVFDFVGNVTNIELKLNESDSYALNDVLGLRFKTSLRSMRLYFQRIFYLPINMYMSGTAIATYRMDFANLLPPDDYFSDNKKYTYNGSFSFNRLGRADSAREPKPPLMEYSFSVDVKTIFSKQEQEQPERPPTVASGVIRELPKDRMDPEVTSVSHRTASVCSLNVGAELSASEGSYGSVGSARADGHDSDPADLRNAQNRRRKFTRLQDEQDILESEDEQFLGKTYSALVVRKDLNLNESVELQPSKTKKVELSDGSETEMVGPCVINKIKQILEEQIEDDKKLKTSVKEFSDLENNTGLLKKHKIKSQGSKEMMRESSPTKIKSLENMTPYMDNSIEEHTSLQLFELEEMKLAKQAELETLRRQRFKAGLSESSPRRRESKIIKTTKVNQDVLGDQSFTEAQPSKPTISEKKVSKTNVKRVSKTALNEDILRSKTINNKQTDNIVFIEDSYEQSEEDLRYGLVSSREKLCKKPKSPKSFKASDSRGSDLETETDLSILDVQSKLKTKPKSRKPKEMEDFEEISTSTQETRNSGASKSDLALRARWVEVNKVQSQALGETEKFLQETCRAELDEVLYEDQLALGLAKPPKPKKKLGTVKAKTIDYEDSYVEGTSRSQSSSLTKKLKKAVPSENQLHQAEFGCSEEYISLSEINLGSAEMMYLETEQRVTFAHSKDRLKKKKRSPYDEEQENQIRFRSSEENNSLSEENLKPVARSKDECVKKKKKISSTELRTSEESICSHGGNKKSTESISSGADNRDSRIKRKKTASKAEIQLIQVEVASSQEFISTSEDNSKSVEISKPGTQQSDAKIVRKKKIMKSPVDEDCETLQEEFVKPVKKKITRKKTSVVTDNVENEEPPEEVVHIHTKKVVKKKSKPVVDSHEECKTTQRRSSKSSVKKIRPQNEYMNLTATEEDFGVDPTLNNDSVGQKIKSWRRQQIEIFEQELLRKELHYKKQLEEIESQEARTHKLNKVEADLDETFISKRTSVSDIDYEAKFRELEEHISLLKSEMEEQVRLFEDRSVELRQENLQLCTEKTELKVRIAAMEQQIGALKAQGTEEGDLKQVLGELKSQNLRFLNVAREREYYKKRWRRSARRVHALKLAAYERNLEREHNSLKVEPIDLRQILTKDAIEFEREYGKFRQNGLSQSYSYSSQTGSGDFLPPNK
ncbi:uncharacterized protein LOC108095739 isoform X2 [Drosophila ficusphila]|uniref:uncharacterized protein LOC108095739 isoform X2 n=1 Tax=Drosophila ficusphila TaxID=30025 RepID=UPI0007E70298|nr:uncharacterized protein LOC108095739 isoform X2 [Drosophila ficusphila]